MSEAEDAARYRFLMAKCVKMADATREGPEHPELYFYADLFNERSDMTAADRIEREIDFQRLNPKKFEWRRT